MIDINLFDNAFKHLVTEDLMYSVTDNKYPAFTRYIRNQYDWDGITIFTDSFILSDIVDKVNSKYKIGWIIENRETNNSSVFSDIERVIDKFDFIITYDDELREKYPTKTEFYPFGGSWVFRENYGMYEKSKNISMIYSNKQATTGHKLRHEVANLISNVDFYGSGVGVDFSFKEEILSPYRFSIVIENSKSNDYFSEKLLDCISVGTIPIYWGANNIGNYFDTRGFIIFNNIYELIDILPTLNEQMYQSMLEFAMYNLDKVTTYDTQEDWIFENIYLKRGIINNVINENIPTNDIRTMVSGKLQSNWLNKFFSDGGDNLLYNLDFLTSNSIVFDIGSYNGDYSNKLNVKYGSYIYGFEPIKSNFINSLIFENEKVKFFNLAIGSIDKVTQISISNNNSSVFLINEEMEDCLERDIVGVMDELNINKVDLMQMNIEGGEYNILNRLIESNLIGNIDNILVQFHYYGDNPVFQRHKIIETLSKTHYPQFCYPFIWELWRLK